ncbi:hypothetical protein P1X15_16670 [Runella sp. MFBS21]|uniref:hypothetical protein n=1 Tax=Runella sp. MFBS21 TaxID=3034018 RepID=UPI0023F798E2|nr:hypothetical protein [Runella sp. MFBS21]MDF7819255.1 hypothetical protein [Runella sp. MFBS21]
MKRNNRFSSSQATPQHEGRYNVTASVGSCTTSAYVDVLVQAPCVAGVTATPQVSCDSSGTATVTFTTSAAAPSGYRFQYKTVLVQQDSLSGQWVDATESNWQSSNVFAQVPDGRYKVKLRTRIDNQNDLFQPHHISEVCATSSEFDVACTQFTCDYYIKAVNASGQEVSKLTRVAGSNSLYQTVTLSAAFFEAAPANLSYSWTGPGITTPITSSQLSAHQIGEYKLTLTQGTTTCEAYINLSGTPCSPIASAPCGSVPTINIVGGSTEAGPYLTGLAVGDEFTAADYTVTVTSLYSAGGDTYSGEGYVTVKLVGGTSVDITVEFADIKINDCYQLVVGTVKSMYDPSWSNVADVDDLLSSLKDASKQIKDLLAEYKGTPQQISTIQNTLIPLLQPYKDNPEVAAVINQLKTLSTLCKADANGELPATCQAALDSVEIAYNKLNKFIDFLPPFPSFIKEISIAAAPNGRVAAEDPVGVALASVFTLAAADACGRDFCQTGSFCVCDTINDGIQGFYQNLYSPEYKFWRVKVNGEKYWVIRMYSLSDVIYAYRKVNNDDLPNIEVEYQQFRPQGGLTAAAALADAGQRFVFQVGLMLATGGGSSVSAEIVSNVADAFITAAEDSNGDPDKFVSELGSNLAFSALGFLPEGIGALKKYFRLNKFQMGGFPQAAKNALDNLRANSSQWTTDFAAFKNNVAQEALPKFKKIFKNKLSPIFQGISAVGAKIDHKNKQILDAAGNTIATFQNNVLKFTERAVPAGWTKKSTFHEAEIEEVIDGIPVRKKTDVDVWTCPTYVAPRGRASAESDCIVLKIATGSIDDLLEIARKMLKDMGQVGRANDKDVLYKIVDFINPTNPESVTALQRLGGIEHLKQVLRSNPYAPCCGGKGNSYFPSIAEHLGYLRTTLLEFGGDNATTGFGTFMKTLKNNSAIGAQDGSAHALKKLAQYKKADVVAMEGKIAEDIDLDAICTGCLFDIKLTNGTFIELKSYKKETLDGIASSTKFINQFKQYLQSLSTEGKDISKLKYVFNGKKVSEKEVKEAFVKLFNRKAEEIYSANESVFNAFGLNVAKLKNITDQHEIFDLFIDTLN